MDATVCEFCGWDFNEEDEWILQIEKLERDLMLEKQKFTPGSVDDKIESSLHAPAEVKAEMLKAAPKPVQKSTQKEPLTSVTQPAKPVPRVKPAAPSPGPVTREAQRPAPTPQPSLATQPVVDRIGPPASRQSIREPPPAVPRRVETPSRTEPAKTVQSSPPVPLGSEPAPQSEAPAKLRKVRAVRAEPESVVVASSNPTRKLVRVVKAKKSS